MTLMEWIKAGLDVSMTLLGFITAVLLIRPTVAKHIDEYRNRHKMRLRGEAEFALKMADNTGDVRYKDLAAQLGLAAALGNPDLQNAQRQALMNLEDPVHWAARYEKSERFVQIDAKALSPFEWRADYACVRRRWWFRMWRFLVVLVFVIPWAALPLSLDFFFRVQSSKALGAVAAVLWLFLMLGAALLVLKQLSDLNEAEELVADAPRRIDILEKSEPAESRVPPPPCLVV